MLQTKTKTIGNHSYTVRQLGASEGRKMLMRLIKVLGPVLSTLLTGEGGKAKVKGWSFLETPLADIGKALLTFSDRISEQDLEYLCATLGMATEVHFPDGKTRPLTLEEQELHFAGRYSDMFRWLGFALEANYSDFFGSSSALAGALARMEIVEAPEEKAS
jgi:CYTH domain-containing protein